MGARDREAWRVGTYRATHWDPAFAGLSGTLETASRAAAPRSAPVWSSESPDGDTGPVSTYDPDRLAEVRGYEHLPVAAVFWSLDRAVNDWQEALRTLGDAPDLVLTHPLRGDEPISAVRRWVAHETHHHGYDIRRAGPDNSGAG